MRKRYDVVGFGRIPLTQHTAPLAIKRCAAASALGCSPACTSAPPGASACRASRCAFGSVTDSSACSAQSRRAMWWIAQKWLSSSSDPGRNRSGARDPSNLAKRPLCVSAQPRRRLRTTAVPVLALSPPPGSRLGFGALSWHVTLPSAMGLGRRASNASKVHNILLPRKYTC